MEKNYYEFKSLNQGTYMVYNDSIVFLDPLFIFINKKMNEGLNPNQIKELPFKLFPNGIKPSETEIMHYFRKCKYFKNFYKNNTIIPPKLISLDSKDILFNIANLKQITFEITDSCNLNCHYCGYGDFYGNHDIRRNKEFDVESAKTILDFILNYLNSDLNISHEKTFFISFYGGEPLLKMECIREIVNYSKHKTLLHNNIVFSMTTNGVLLKKNVDYLVKNNFKLLISLDGNKENNSYRKFNNGVESFEVVYENIKYVKSKYPDFFNKMVSFNSVLHNKNSVSEIHNFIKKEFGKIPAISELNSTGIVLEKRKEFYNTFKNRKESLIQAEDYSLIREELFYKIGEANDRGLFLKQCSGNLFLDYNDFFIDKRVLKRKPTGTCSPFGKKMFVTVNGKILACERIGHKFSLGRVNPESIELDFKKIAQMYNNYYAKLIDQCIICYNSDSCTQCIFHMEDIDGAPICKDFINSQQFNVKINCEMAFFENDATMYDRIINELIIET